MQFEYVGMFDEVLVPELRYVPIKRGQVVEVDDEEMAGRLRLQPVNWREKVAGRRGAPSGARGEAGDD
jgi:hypothetical protein